MEFLKQYLTPELYSQVETALKGNDKVRLGNLADGEFVSKDKYAAENAKVTDLSAQIAERDKQISELGKMAGLSEELKKQITDLQNGNANTQKEWEAKLKKQAFDFALNGELKDTYKAKDILSVMPHLKTDAISLQDGKFIGLDEQMKELTKNKAFLFGNDATPGGTGSPANPPTPDGGGAWDFGFTAVNTPNQK